MHVLFGRVKVFLVQPLVSSQQLLLGSHPHPRHRPEEPPSMHRQSLVDYGKPLQDTEAPTPAPKGSEVLLRVSHCGVCHSDVHLQDGYVDLGDGDKLDVRSGRHAAAHARPRDRRHAWRRMGPEAQGCHEGQALRRLSLDRLRRVRHVQARPRASVQRRARSASRSTAAIPSTCWCRIRDTCSTSTACPEIAGALMCSGITGYGASRKRSASARAGRS